MKSLMSDESADSMVIFVIASGTLLFGLMFLFLSEMTNLPIASINMMIAKGTLSVDTVTHFQTTVQMWQAAPYFFIVGLILFCFERMKGDSVSSDTYFGYLVLMIITLQISAYMVWTFGLCADSMITSFESQVDWMNYGLEWDVSRVRNICLQLMYYGALLPGFLGSILYMLHPILKQRQNDVAGFLGNGSDSEDGSQEYISNYSMDQM